MVNKAFLEKMHKECFAIMQSHPDLKMAKLHWYKCPICGYCKRIEPDNAPKTKTVQTHKTQD